MITHLHSAYGTIGTTECGAANHTPFAKKASEATCPLCVESASRLRYTALDGFLSSLQPSPSPRAQAGHSRGLIANHHSNDAEADDEPHLSLAADGLVLGDAGRKSCCDSLRAEHEDGLARSVRPLQEAC